MTYPHYQGVRTRHPLWPKSNFDRQRRFVVASDRSAVGWIVERHKTYYAILWGPGPKAKIELVPVNEVGGWSRFAYLEAAQEMLANRS